MERERSRLVPGQPARLLEPVEQVEILHVHPVVLVEKSDRLERAPPREHERAVDRIDRPRLDIRRPVLREWAVADEASDPCEVSGRTENRGKRSARRMVEG